MSRKFWKSELYTSPEWEDSCILYFQPIGPSLTVQYIYIYIYWVLVCLSKFPKILEKPDLLKVSVKKKKLPFNIKRTIFYFYFYFFCKIDFLMVWLVMPYRVPFHLELTIFYILKFIYLFILWEGKGGRFGGSHDICCPFPVVQAIMPLNLWQWSWLDQSFSPSGKLKR